MDLLPYRSGLQYNGTAPVRARRPIARADRAGEVPAWRLRLTGRFCFSILAFLPCHSCIDLPSLCDERRQNVPRKKDCLHFPAIDYNFAYSRRRAVFRKDRSMPRVVSRLLFLAILIGMFASAVAA